MLGMAVKRGNKEMVQALIQAKANLETEVQPTLCDVASTQRDARVQSYFVGLQGRGTCTPLHIAACGGNVSAIQLLVDAG
jgi:hypothetical protein